MELLDFLKIPFDDGLENFIKRYPVLADSAEELRQRYSKENVFGLVRSNSMILTNWLQKYIGKAMEKGLETNQILDFIKESLQERNRIYADTVWRTNLNTAHNAGRQRQAKKYPGFIVGFEFSATKDGSVRNNHKLADGLRAPADHEAWDFFTPPLGYNCRCVIRQITRPEAERKGWLDDQGRLIPWHPKLKDKVSVSALMNLGAGPDLPEFGRRAI